MIKSNKRLSEVDCGVTCSLDTTCYGFAYDGAEEICHFGVIRQEISDGSANNVELYLDSEGEYHLISNLESSLIN